MSFCFLIWCIAQLQLMNMELSRQLSWLSMHPTDASGWSYRAHLLEVWRGKRNAEEEQDKAAFLEQLWQEAKNVDSLLRAVPENEPVWVYRRLLDVLFVEKTDPSSLPAFDCLAAAAAQQPTSNSSDHNAPISLTSCSTTAPGTFSGPWASLLYHRHINWLREFILPRLVGSPAILVTHPTSVSKPSPCLRPYLPPRL
uniref:Geranylgeranyl transferase type-2 subunit alpha n=1 Tax=Schistocephalus solidus TaxID=70667 RepID=A0A0X3Q4K0_SCHSO